MPDQFEPETETKKTSKLFSVLAGLVLALIVALWLLMH